MNPFHNLPAVLAAYRQDTGVEPTDTVRRFFAAFSEILDRFEAQGREDAAQRRPYSGPEAFAAFGEKIAIGEPELDGLLLEFVQNAYRDGYDAAGHKGR